MSTDDIVFDEIQYREPKKARRPDRDRRWACVAYEVPRPEDLPIFLDRKPADAIERHALRDTSVELGGIMLGLECVDDQTGEAFVWVTESLEAKHYENTQASFTYTHESWAEITRERDRLHPELDIVGWYHTHPDFGIFLSSHDLFIHRNFFAQPLQLAYVVDPVRQTRGFFRWRDGGLDQVGGYYLSADRSERVALARLANDLESIPDAGDGGGLGAGLSPRLEAELIAMLTRPHQQAPAASAADRAQLAALFGTIGLFAGVVLFAALAFLYSLTTQVHEQTAALIELKRSVAETGQVQQVAMEALLAKAEAPMGAKGFVESLSRAKKDLADVSDKARSLEALARAAGSENRKLVDEIDGLRKDVAKAKEESKKEEDKVEEQRSRLRDYDEFFKTDKGDLYRKYQFSWYAAAAGWVVAVIAVLGVVALWASRTPLGGEDPREGGPFGGMGNMGGVATPPQEPPHQIL